MALIVAWFIARTIKDSVVDVARITNESMLPYLWPGQRVLISRLSPCLHMPVSGKSVACRPCEAGKAYIFMHPQTAGMKLVKFAVDFPAARRDAILRRDIMWFTEGERTLLSAAAVATQNASYTMNRDNACFFVGSNAEISVDSRHFGPVPLEMVLGRIVYPPFALPAEKITPNVMPE